MAPRQAFLRACALDVAVRKPGNVGPEGAAHGMHAAQFIQSAAAAADALFNAEDAVGRRIENAVAATWAAVGCNTNLGILLLCAPLARAAEREAGVPPQALEAVLAGLTREDAACAYRAIALASPGGLGRVSSQDVHNAPTVTLREAMALAADRDRIARQYRDGFAELFEIALPALPCGFSLPWLVPGARPDAATTAAVQALYLCWLASDLDSHIVRKHGAAVAQNVMTAAQAWRAGCSEGRALDTDPAFLAWDLSLKASGVNPGTTADLTVATLMLAGLRAPVARIGGTERDNSTQGKR